MVSEIAVIDWARVIENMKKEYPLLHVFYSSEDGWANLSYKSKTAMIRRSMAQEHIRIIVAKLFDENIF